MAPQQSLPKHFDLMLLGAAIVVMFLVVVILDPTGSRAMEAAGKLEGENSLYQPDTTKVAAERVDGKTDSKASAKKVVKERPTWLDDETGRSQPGASSIPAPLRLGVVNLGESAAMGGRLPFPADSAWNQTIDHLPVDPLSELLIENIGLEKNLHPDFGAGLWEGAPIGIPYVVVDGQHKRYPIRYTAYGDESDPGPYPIPTNAPIEGDPKQDGDRHVIVIDRDEWKLYELFRAFPVASGQLWKAESGAIFDLKEHPTRPIGWTSADAAGLPIFPGLVRYDEVVELKEIRHALRFTVQKSRRAYVPPATHWASKSKELYHAPMGMRVRLKKDYDITGFSPEAQVILTALKKYGMILADNGGNWFISGAPHPSWNDENLHQLKRVKGKDLEVVVMEGLVEDR